MHPNARGSYLTQSVPALHDNVFSAAALELSIDVAPELAEFAARGDITQLAQAICSRPNWYCENCWRFALWGGAGDNLVLTLDYQALLQSLQANGMSIRCIDAPRDQRNDLRDRLMADGIADLLKNNDRVIWQGGARHMIRIATREATYGSWDAIIFFPFQAQEFEVTL